jgi:diacylglycerol kinase family enzyme
VSIVVVANSGAGILAASRRRRLEARLREAFAAEGVEAEVQVVRPRELAGAVRAAAMRGASAVVVAGGDGTISTAAAILAGGKIPLGVLPLGTLNHFAKDVGIPLTLPEAVRAIAHGTVRQVDVGEVNGRIFVNNSSIGLYTHMVRRRDAMREQLGRGKWVAMFWATVAVFRRFPVIRTTLEMGGRAVSRTTPFVFVGNNEYEMSLLALGRRSRLDAGVLSIYVGNRTGRFGMLRLAFRALLGRLRQAADFDDWVAPELLIETRRRRVRVAADGEVMRMQPPLRYRSRPKHLSVIVPDEGNGP